MLDTRTGYEPPNQDRRNEKVQRSVATTPPKEWLNEPHELGNDDRHACYGDVGDDVFQRLYFDHIEFSQTRVWMMIFAISFWLVREPREAYEMGYIKAMIPTFNRNGG